MCILLFFNGVFWYISIKSIQSKCQLKNISYYCLFIWPCQVLLAACRILVASCRISTAVHRLSGCGTWAPVHGVSSCGARVQLLSDVWDLSSPTRNRTHVLCIPRQILNHLTSREILSLMCHLRANISLLIFCLDDLSRGKLSKVLYCSSVHVSFPL